MANALTGDFDLAAQFSTDAIDRLLAAMHRAQRFPHSLTLRVEDIGGGIRGIDPSIVSSVDLLGDATVDPGRVPPRLQHVHGILDSVINTDLAGINLEPLVPSNLRGRAQLQLSPPTIDVAAGSGSRVTLRIDLMSRYFPEPSSPQVAEFIKGRLAVTAPIAQMGTQAAHVIDVDFRSPSVVVNFTPSWSSRPIPPEDLAAINLLIRNALKTSFLPSNTVLPAQIKQLAFKTFGGSSPAIAALMNVREESGTGTPGSATTRFIESADHFAFAAGIDFVRATFDPTLQSILSTPVEPVPVAWTEYTVEIKNGDLDLQPPNRVVLSFRGEARTPSRWLPNFGFTARQVLRLRVDGSTVDFTLDQPSLELSNSVAEWITDPFQGGFESQIAVTRDQALEASQARQKIRQLLDADRNLGVFLRSFFAQPRTFPLPPQRGPQPITLAYTSVRVQQEGVVLHGSLSVQDWPPPHVEFEEIPHQSGGPGGIVDSVFDGPDYSALKTWIPGGIIQQYEWHHLGGSRFIDPNRFVMLHQGPVVSDGGVAMRMLPGFNALCLTINGTRLTSSGPVAAQPVGATYCAYSSFPIVSDALLEAMPPAIALVERDSQGLVNVTAHTRVRTGARGNAPNVLVHFGDSQSADHLEELVAALRESGRDDGTTAVVAVLDADQLKRAPFVAGVTYGDNSDKAWNSLLGTTQEGRATTLLVTPDGKVAWRHEGELRREALRDALRQHAAPIKNVRITAHRSNLRIGHPPPNLLFEYAPGRLLTLRKASGRPVVLVFWRGSAPASIDAVRELQSRAEYEGASPLVLAINDGDAPESAAKIAADNRWTAILVSDPERTIAQEYGITVWPTIIDVDALGVVRGVRYRRPTPTRGVEQHV
jgi:peroxiredoxin